jgi:hypothetical protein
MLAAIIPVQVMSVVHRINSRGFVRLCAPITTRIPFHRARLRDRLDEANRRGSRTANTDPIVPKR